MKKYLFLVLLMVVAVAISVTNSNLDTEVKNTEKTSSDEVIHEETPSVVPTTTPSPIPTELPTVVDENNEEIVTEDINYFIYVPSVIVSKSSGYAKLTSTDGAEKITDWYKNRIKSKGMNVTSFVSTNTNGNILNKLAGANNSESVEITITKESGDKDVTIEISI